MFERLGLRLLHCLEPERAHNLALQALKFGIAPRPRRFKSVRLHTQLAGFKLENPLGLAAGFDKSAEILTPLSKLGFGFLEIGAVTPLAQFGNLPPRLFRLANAQAIINRFGFNNDGATTIAARLAKRPSGGIIGINIGANKDSSDRIQDFCRVLEIIGPRVDFVTINISSPNTENLRDLQAETALPELLSRVFETRVNLGTYLPVFVKVAPDLTDAQIATISRIVSDAQVDGLIATNTTLSRKGLPAHCQDIPGGVSGQPLFMASTRVLARFYRETGGKLPLIGVGGIGSAGQAAAKIKAGATAIQLYSALTYEGFGLVPKILEGLDELLAKENKVISQWVGCDSEKYAKIST